MLLARLYKGRYHNSSMFLESISGNQDSFAWKSIQAGNDLLQQRLRIHLGDGENKRFWLDPWLPTTTILIEEDAKLASQIHFPNMHYLMYISGPNKRCNLLG